MKCVFISYPLSVKGYRLWVKQNNDFKVIISKDVIFEERIVPCRVVNVLGTCTVTEIENSNKGYEF